MTNARRIWFLIGFIGALLNVCALCHAYTLDEWVDAIFEAEGGEKATYLYGIRSIPYDTPAQARQYCKNTVYNTLIKYRTIRCKDGESDIDCMARRYCPVGSDTDNGTCRHWKKNVQWFLNESEVSK